MSGPIAHVGLHKTATSWFQKVAYPHLTSHRLVDRELVRKIFLCNTAFDFDPAAARAKLEIDSDEKPALLCEEDLSGVLHLGLSSGLIAKEVASRIHRTMPDARIVLFVRAQPTAALSWYVQYVREGGTASVRRYLFPAEYRHLGHSRPYKVPSFDFSQLDYRGIIETYDALFGRDRVHVFTFEQFAKDRRGLLAEMERKLELKFDPFPVDAGRRVNDSYRRGLLPVARTMNLFTSRSVVDKRTLVHLPYWYTARKFLLKKLNALPLFGGRPVPERLLGPEVIDFIRHRFWKSNRWLSERTGIDLAELGYPVCPPDCGNAPPRRSPLVSWMKN